MSTSTYPLTKSAELLPTQAVAPARTHCRAALQFAGAHPWAVLTASLVVLVPCFWQPHILAGDLLSHVYNAWLASLVQEGRVPGLWIATQKTNVLFDLLLSSLFNPFGALVAERGAAAIAALVFFWGAFATAAVVSGRAPWYLTPCIAMLTYGWVFQIGLFNYFVSFGLSLLILPLLWSGRLWDVAAAVPLVALAWLAQPLPLVWAASLAAYVWLARRVRARHRLLLFAAGIVLLVSLGQLLRYSQSGVWDLRQAFFLTGLDQVLVYRKAYLAVFAGLVMIWGSLLIAVLRQRGTRESLEIPIHLYLLSAAGCVAIPNVLQKMAYSGIAQRFSLTAAVMMCAIVASATPALWQRVGVVALSMLYFALLYSDARSFSSLEAKISTLLDRLPPNQRVIGDFDQPHFRSYDLNMLLDHACIGRCFSYANYEASTGQFRVRANPGNTFVVWSGGPGSAKREFFEAQSALPLYEIYSCGGGMLDICMRTLKR